MQLAAQAVGAPQKETTAPGEPRIDAPCLCIHCPTSEEQRLLIIHAQRAVQHLPVLPHEARAQYLAPGKTRWHVQEQEPDLREMASLGSRQDSGMTMIAVLLCTLMRGTKLQEGKVYPPNLLICFSLLLPATIHVLGAFRQACRIGKLGGSLMVSVCRLGLWRC